MTVKATATEKKFYKDYVIPLEIGAINKNNVETRDISAVIREKLHYENNEVKPHIEVFLTLITGNSCDWIYVAHEGKSNQKTIEGILTIPSKKDTKHDFVRLQLRKIHAIHRGEYNLAKTILHEQYQFITDYSLELMPNLYQE